MAHGFCGVYGVNTVFLDTISKTQRHIPTDLMEHSRRRKHLPDLLQRSRQTVAELSQGMLNPVPEVREPTGQAIDNGSSQIPTSLADLRRPLANNTSNSVEELDDGRRTSIGHSDHALSDVREEHSSHM